MSFVAQRKIQFISEHFQCKHIYLLVVIVYLEFLSGNDLIRSMKLSKIFTDIELNSNIAKVSKKVEVKKITKLLVKSTGKARSQSIARKCFLVGSSTNKPDDGFVSKLHFIFLLGLEKLSEIIN